MRSSAVVLLLLGLIAAAGCVPEGGSESQEASPSPAEAQPPDETQAELQAQPRERAEEQHACQALDGSRPFQDVVDEHDAGTCFIVTGGTHREQSVVPRDGDSFRGEPGAVWSGARVLDDWQQDEAGRWFAEDQTQEGWLHPGTELLPGREVDNLPEELFVDGVRRLERVGRLGELRSGRWFLEHETDRIYLADDPAEFEMIETSVTTFALAGQGVRDVLVESLTFEKFASPAQFGPVGGTDGERWSHDWTIRSVTSRLNHGVGIVVGPGTTIEDSLVHDNGQIGITGDGVDRSDYDYAAPVVIRRTEVRDNAVLGFDWRWEAGGVKIKHSLAGAEITECWVHGNGGPGIWYDIDNYDVVIRENLVERNEQAGILYEISFGDAVIEGNLVRGNGGPGVDVSTSQGVEVVGNVLTDNADGIAVRVGNRAGSESPTGNRYDTREVSVRSNDIALGRGATGYETQDNLDRPDPQQVVFAENSYRISWLNRAPFLWADRRMTARAWRAEGHDDGPEFEPDGLAPVLPSVESLAERRFGADT